MSPMFYVSSTVCESASVFRVCLQQTSLALLITDEAEMLTDCNRAQSPSRLLGQGIWLAYHLFVDCSTGSQKLAAVSWVISITWLYERHAQNSIYFERFNWDCIPKSPDKYWIMITCYSDKVFNWSRPAINVLSLCYSNEANWPGLEINKSKLCHRSTEKATYKQQADRYE